MTKNRVALLIAMFIISCSCIVYMNFHYDVLARNTYVTKENHDLLVKVLDDQQIRYIVENNIDVTLFDEFLTDAQFDFNHYRDYAKAKSIRNGSVHEIVVFVNQISDSEYFDLALEALSYYSYDELKSLILNGSPYNKWAQVVWNPTKLDVYLNLSNTIGSYEPTDLVDLSTFENIFPTDDVFYLRKEAAEALDKMCKYVANENWSMEMCDGWIVDAAYLSYDDIQKTYIELSHQLGGSEAFNHIGWPSHNEHQLGLCVDLIKETTTSSDIVDNELKTIAHLFGFISYEQKVADFSHLSDSTHWRYVGVDMATSCYLQQGCIYD